MIEPGTVVGYGTYADQDRRFRLPKGWEVASAQVLQMAESQALTALRHPSVLDRVRAYYDRDGDYAGTTFLDAEPNRPDDITAADLWAVATLSVRVHARQGRLLLEGKEPRGQVLRQLRHIDSDASITDLEKAKEGSVDLLERMWNLHETFKSILATEEKRSERWVFAAKLSARKRPRLFPVRDDLVCRWLAEGRRLNKGNGWPGNFSIDIQVWGRLMTVDAIRDEVARIRHEITDVRLDAEDLRLFDVALWTCAKAALG